MKAIFCYKVFGLTEDINTGEPDYGYVKIASIVKYGNAVEIQEEEYEKVHKSLVALISEQTVISESEITPVSLQEYEENTDD